MEFELGTAVVAGLTGTAVMTAALYMGYLMNLRMEMPMLLGTMFLPKGAAAWLVGLTLHFTMGAAFFVLYAALFDALALESGVGGWAALFGLVHGAIAGAALGLMPAMRPRLVTADGPEAGERVPSPGVFALRLGMMGPLALLALHLVYGVVGGLVYTA